MRCYPSYRHVFVYDNATTHLKWADDALSARRMPKGPSASFGVDRTHTGPDGKTTKIRVQMADGKLPDGSSQSLYFPNGEGPNSGMFKGMAQILEERGFNVSKLQAECPGFQCPSNQTNQCCCRRLLYSQPDFAEVESLLEQTLKEKGYQVIFLPKYHCELNPIEQCWGYAKRLYRELPISHSDLEMEANVLASLKSIPLDSMLQLVVFFDIFTELIQ